MLRIREPNLERPCAPDGFGRAGLTSADRTWLVTPIAFTTVALFLLLMPIVSAPLQALAAFLFIAAGVPIYFLTKSRYSISPSTPARMRG